MTRQLLGPPRQIGLVVPDFDAALEYWTTVMGAGPFFITRKVQFENYRYRGQLADAPTVSLAFGQFGAMQVEIIAQHDDLPCGYNDYLHSGARGPQHFAHWFADRASFEQAGRELCDRGFKVRHAGGDAIRFAYFSLGDGIYPEVEIAEALSPMAGDWVKQIADAHVNWDGSAPLRTADGTPEAA